MRKHRPPSQIRYEKSHPTISFRLDIELKKRLEKVLEGKSFADFVKEGLGVREREKASLKNARDDGYDKGYEDAKKRFGIYAKCGICGENLLVRTAKLKSELRRYVEEGDWCHRGCIEKEKAE